VVSDRKRNFIIAFGILWVITFVDVHFLSFFPLTIRDPLPLGMSAIVATLVGVLAGLIVLQKGT
jgi:hypothetical protein